MKLVLSAKKQPTVDSLSVSGLFAVAGIGLNEKASIKKLKVGQRLYPFVKPNGTFDKFCAVYRSDPSDELYQEPDRFVTEASLSFQLMDYPPYGTSYLDKNPKLSKLREETLKLSASRLYPPYLEISKITFNDDGDVAVVQGTISRAWDARLQYLSPNEETAFGSGHFEASRVLAVHDGSYIYPEVTPFAPRIKEIVEKQREIRNQYSGIAIEIEKTYNETLSKDKKPDPKVLATLIEENKSASKLLDELELTRVMLRPHAGEIYEFDQVGQEIFYISRDGEWLRDSVPGLRPLDMHDRLRVANVLASLNEGEAESPEALRNARESFHTLTQGSRYDIKKFFPLLAPHVEETRDADIKAYTARQEKLKSFTPLSGPLGPEDLPGLKEGVRFFPHQSLLLATLRDEEADRMLLDADPGAGKTIMILADILMKMKSGRVRRPLVLMPESLLSNFANEVREFTELNPWIFNTEAVASWSKEGLPKFVKDAASAPPNTVFITSYNWIGRDGIKVQTGAFSKNKYETRETFPRARMFLEEVKIDGLWQDECHVLKNASKGTWAATELSTVPIVRGFTGTIMPGNLADVTGPMESIHSGLFGTQDEFNDKYSADGSVYSYKDDAAKKIRSVLTGYGMRSMRRSAWAHLMPASEKHYHYVDFSPAQQKVYNAILTDIMDEIEADPRLGPRWAKMMEDMEENGDESANMTALLSKFVPLDVYLNSPATAHKRSQMLDGPEAISPKAGAVADIIKKHLADPENGKILVLVQYKDGAKALLNALPPDIKAVAAFYEGGMIEELAQLKNASDPLRVLVGVDRSLRTGHNLQSVNCIIHADITWLAGDMSQREARAFRIGQKRKVHIHYVVANNTAEMLKVGRMISSEHMVAKANSDFDDETNFEILRMNLHNMKDFRSRDQLAPYVERRAAIEVQFAMQSEKEAQLYGPHLISPRGYTPIANVLKGSRMLTRVPSAGVFVGITRSVETITEDELMSLPSDPERPKTIDFHLQNWEDDWYLTVNQAVDPQGFVRKYRFKLFRDIWYLMLKNKQDALSQIKKLEKSFNLLEKDALLDSIQAARVFGPGVREQLKKQALEDRSKSVASFMGLVTAAQEKTKLDLDLKFATQDGSPLLFVNNLKSGNPEVKNLRPFGFTHAPPVWMLDMTKSKLPILLRRMLEENEELRLGGWDEFKEQASRAFRGIDLSEFDARSDSKTKDQLAVGKIRL